MARFKTMHERDVREAVAEEEYQQRIDKRKATASGDLVQSEGEKRIREFLDARHILYEYDARLTLLDANGKERWARPDFVLKDAKVVIEYAGMRSQEYLLKLEEKKKLYLRNGYDCIVLTPADIDHLTIVLPMQLLRAGVAMG